MSKGMMWSMFDLTKDSKYTGAGGSETNPWAVEDVYDFCAIVDDSDKDTTYYQLVNNIEFNNHETYKNGIQAVEGFKIVDASKSVVIGSGKAIRNIVYLSCPYEATQSSIFRFKEVNNVKFENVVLGVTVESRAGASYISLFSGTFKQCALYVLLNNANVRALFQRSDTITESSLTFGGTCNNRFVFGLDITISRCNICFDELSFKQDANYLFDFHDDILTMVCFTGRINVTNLNTELWMFQNCTITNCEFFVEIQGSQLTGVVAFKHPWGEPVVINGVNIYSKDLINEGKADYSTYLAASTFALPDEDCKNPTYLASLGFPVIGA